MSAQVSLVIPCYNESKRFELLVNGIDAFIKNWKDSFEILIVNDGSKDDTLSLLQNHPLLSKNEHIKILDMPANGGKGKALQYGIAHATGAYILTLDADMSAKPTMLNDWKKLDPHLFKKNEIYIGSRMHDKSVIEALSVRKNLGNIFNTSVQLLTPLNLQDTQCGFKLYPAAVAKNVFGNLLSTGWAHDVEALYRAQNQGIRVNEMPIQWKNEEDSKVNVWVDGIKMFLQLLFISISLRFSETFISPFKNVNLYNEKFGSLYRLAFWVIAIGILFLFPKISFHYGVTGDEHWHHDYGNAIYHYFADGDKSMLEWKRVEMSKKFEESGIHYYGGLFDLWVALWNKKVGLWGDYEMMHFWCSIIGAIGIIVTGLLATELGGWLMGLLALLLIALSPSYIGHCFNNPKDIPFATATIFTIYQMVKFLRQLPKPSLKTSILLALGIGAALGVRIGGVLYIFYLGLFTVITCYANKDIKQAFSMPMIIRLAAISIGGYVLGLVAWPYGHSSPIAHPIETIQIMSNFFTQLPMLFDGERIQNNEVPWNYIPQWISITAPIYFLIGIVGFLVVAFLNRNKLRLIPYALILFAVLFPWMVAVKKESALYDGWRHFLFVYPLLIILVAYFWHSILNSKNKIIALASTVILVGLMALPIKFIAKNHPNEYLYFNEYFGGIENAYTNYETDYYMNTAKQAFDWLAKNELANRKDTVLIRTNCVDPVSYYRLEYLVDGPVHIDLKNGEYPDYGLKFKNRNVAIGYVSYRNKDNMDDYDYGIFYSRFLDKESLLQANYFPPADAIHVIRVDSVPVMVVVKRNTKGLKKQVTLAEAFMAKQQPDSALQILNTILASNPANMPALNNFMQISFTKKDWAGMVSKCKNALQVSPNNDQLYYYAGMALANSGKVLEAKQALQTALQINPNATQAQQLLQQLK